MSDQTKTNAELSKEISALKQRIQELEQLEPERKQAEEALWESEEKFRTIFDRASDGILIADAITKKFLQGNTAICSMLGYTKEEIKSLTIYDIHLPQDISRVLDGFEKQAKGETALAEDRPVLRKDGSIFYADISAAPAIIGGVHCLMGIFRDITARKRGEEELNRAKEFLDAVLDNLSDSLIVVDPTNHTILAANKTFINSFGLDEDTVIGKSCYELTHNRSTPCSPPNDICPLVETLKTRKYATVEHIHQDSTGSKLYVEVSTVPIISKGGEIHQVIHLSRNITERKRTEETLQKTNLELLAIIDNLPFLAWLKDSEGRFMAVNEPFARACGLSSANDLVGKTDLDIWPKHLAEAYRADDFEVMRTGQKKAVEELVADRGVEKWFKTYKAPLYEVNGNVIGTTGFSRDITERKQAEEQLQKTLEGLRRAINTTIQVMVSAVEIRDPYTAGHQIRSADLARAIATEMKLPQEKIDAIQIASSIHDIGKLSIPAEILSKPAKLSELEFSLIKEHASRGFEMLKDVESPWPLSEIVYQHHERMDGSGYPRNLKGEEILMEARILNVADVVEAMSSHRPYRPGLGIDAALNEIEKNRGTLYDSTVADACLRLFREKGFKLEGT